MNASFPSVSWQDLNIIRGVDLWFMDRDMLENHDWDVLTGGPAASELRCPVRPGELPPADHNVTFYQQIKGEWFWAMYTDESGLITVKWVRGHCPPGRGRWLE